MRSLDEVMSQQWDKVFPKAVQIETTSLCNARCTFCPYEWVSRMFPRGVMGDELFFKIIRELAEFQPLLIAPYLNNEPLLDKKIIERIRQIRTAMPQTFIDISTNGSALTQSIAEKLLDPVLVIDEIKINFPTTDPEAYNRITGLNYERTLANIRDFVRLARQKQYSGKYRIIIVESVNPKEDKAFWEKEGIEVKVYAKINRGGIIQTGHATSDQISGCKYNREKSWLHILNTGEVILCCMDWFRQHRLGDLNMNSIKEVWKSELYQAIRRRISDSKDKGFICNKCEWGKPYGK